MRRWLFIALSASATVCAQELPQHDAADALDIEPPLLIKDGKPLVPIADTPATASDPEQLAVALERAKKSAAAGERQVRAGIISKAQADERVVKVARLEADLANAQLQQLREAHDAVRKRIDSGEASEAELKRASEAVEHAADSARVAQAHRQQAEVEFARANLQRQQKLLALGSGRKADVQRAEAKLSELIQPSD